MYFAYSLCVFFLVFSVRFFLVFSLCVFLSRILSVCVFFRGVILNTNTNIFYKNIPPWTHKSKKYVFPYIWYNIHQYRPIFTNINKYRQILTNMRGILATRGQNSSKWGSRGHLRAILSTRGQNSLKWASRGYLRAILVTGAQNRSPEAILHDDREPNRTARTGTGRTGTGRTGSTTPNRIGPNRNHTEPNRNAKPNRTEPNWLISVNILWGEIVFLEGKSEQGNTRTWVIHEPGKGDPF